MAVYKPTLCHPFGGGLDIRIGPRGTEDAGDSFLTPLGYLSCRIETSNVPITGYSVALYTANHELLFPSSSLQQSDGHGNRVPYISPLSEIQDSALVPEYDASVTGGVNSGENGSLLKIPFFRPFFMRQSLTSHYASRNAVYYRGSYVVHHILMDPATMAWGTAGGVGYVQEAWENAANWSRGAGTDSNYLIYNFQSWTNGDPLEIDGEPLIIGDLVGVLYSNQSDQEGRGGIYQVRPLASNSNYLGLYRLAPWQDACQLVTVWQGRVQHGTNWYWYVPSSGEPHGDYSIPGEWHKALWWANEGNDKEGLPLDARGTQYQWEVTLYSGKTALGEVPVYYTGGATIADQYGGYLDPADFTDVWWDNTVTAGQILGSNSERLQLSDESERFLPQGTDADPVILQDTYCAVYSGTPGTTAMAQVSRFHVAAHSITLGHVSPAADTTVNISSGDHCSFYEHSQDPTQILDTDIVDYVFTSNQTGFIMGALIDGRWTEYSTEEAWREVSVTDRYWSCPSTWTQTGLILLQNQSNPRENGVWQVQSLTRDAGTYSWIETMPAQDDRDVPSWLTTVSPSGSTPYAGYNGAGYVVPGIASSTTGYRGYGYIRTPQDWESAAQVPADPSIPRYYLRRAAGYNSWASFIGRIIYASAPVGGNYTSLAYASGATLWDPNSLTGQYGAGRLWIKPERPILLFKNKLKAGGDFSGSVCILDKVNTYTTSSTGPASGASYGDYCQPGEYLADASGNIWYIKTKTTNGQSVTWTLSSAWNSSSNSTVAEGDYIWVERVVWTQNGQVIIDDGRGQTVWRRGSSSWGSDPSWDLHRAKILKNTATSTYISPWAEGAINSRMVVELQSPGRISFPGTGNSTTKVHILGWNDVTYRIDHSSLTHEEGSGSSRVVVNGMPSLVDPWTCEIKSFFRTSDPNPFASYEAPYLRLQASGADLATTLGSDRKWQKLLSRGKVSGAAYDHSAWPLDGEFSNSTMPYLEQYWEREPTLGTRYWHLRAFYPLLSGGHWTAYQWRLYDAAGKLLQDSGRRYDGLIDAVFAGLANDARNDTVYYADLTVENTFNDVLHYSIKFAIGANTGQYSDGIRTEQPESFSAHWDCPNQAMILSYSYPARGGSNYACYSIYRREYGIFIDPAYTPIEPEYAYPAGNYRTFIGPWEPVLLQCPANPAGTGNTPDEIRDFNVVNGKTYQYVVYPADADPNAEPAATEQVFANYLGNVWYIENDSAAGRMISGTAIDSKYYGSPEAVTGAECWSMVELEPIEYDPYIPLVRGAYRVNNDNIWLFRFNVETGEQMQNLGRSEFQSLGQYARFGYGRMNHISGSVSAQLGSEIVCSSKYKYIERLPKARIEPLSTNEKAEMLLQWRCFMASRNPKLLRDIKGQSWIVQVMGPSNTPRNYYPNTPDTVSFQWKAIGDPRNVIIYGTYDQIQQQIAEALRSAEWPTAFGNAPTGSPVAEWVHREGQGLWIYRQDTNTYVTQDGTRLTFDIPNNNT